MQGSSDTLGLDAAASLRMAGCWQDWRVERRLVIVLTTMVWI